MSSPTPSYPEVLEALEKAHIPASFATFPNLQISPIPHIPLPSHPHLCLTNYMMSDVPHILENFNDPLVSPGLATPKLMVFDKEAAKRRITRNIEARLGWCFGVIREISDLSNPSPRLVGWLALFPDPRCVLAGPGPKAEAYRARAATLPNAEKFWSLGFALNPPYFRQGIMSAAVNFVITQWFIPHMKCTPGQISSGYYPSNSASAVMHKKINFMPVAITKYWAGRDLKDGEEECICCVWQGAGECLHDDSIYSELPAYP